MIGLLYICRPPESDFIPTSKKPSYASTAVYSLLPWASGDLPPKITKSQASTTILSDTPLSPSKGKTKGRGPEQPNIMPAPGDSVTAFQIHGDEITPTVSLSDLQYKGPGKEVLEALGIEDLNAGIPDFDAGIQ